MAQALGMIETRGLVALIEASDAALKSASVQMVGWDKIGSGMVTTFITGDVGAVKSAMDAAAEATGKIGEVLAVHVIARPHEDLASVLPKSKVAQAAPAVKK